MTSGCACVLCDELRAIQASQTSLAASTLSIARTPSTGHLCEHLVVMQDPLARFRSTLAEDVGEAGRFHSFFDALWWSAATITTVGGGDVSPVTAVGRVVGIFTGIVGISTFAIIAAKVAEFLVRSGIEDGVATSPTEITTADLVQ